jgi:hypothetical protein
MKFKQHRIKSLSHSTILNQQQIIFMNGARLLNETVKYHIEKFKQKFHSFEISSSDYFSRLTEMNVAYTEFLQNNSNFHELSKRELENIGMSLKNNTNVISNMTFSQEKLKCRLKNLRGVQKNLKSMVLEALIGHEDMTNEQSEIMKMQSEHRMILESIEITIFKTSEEMNFNLKSQEKIQKDQETLNEMQKQELSSMNEMKEITLSASENSQEIKSKQLKMIENQQKMEICLRNFNSFQWKQFEEVRDSILYLIQFAGNQLQFFEQGSKEMALMISTMNEFVFLEKRFQEVLENIQSDLNGVFVELITNGENVKSVQNDMIEYFEILNHFCKIFIFFKKFQVSSFLGPQTKFVFLFNFIIVG